MPKKYVFYHEPCLDGFGSAYLHWLFNNKPSPDLVEYRGLTTSAKQKKYLNFDFDKIEKEKAHVTFLDFAPNIDDLIEFHERDIHVCIIDHHKTSIDMLHDLNKKFGISPNTLVLAEENEKSGVGLCFDLFLSLFKDEDDLLGGLNHKDLARCNKMIDLWGILAHIQDRDLWSWKLKNTAEICAALDSYDQTFESWDEILDYESLLRDGKSILRFKKLSIDKIKKSWYPIEVGPYVAAAINSNVFQSELGNELLKENVDLAVVYYDDKHGRKTCSLRSRPDFDCSKIAQFFGGGGHAQASGCQVNCLDDLRKYGS